VDAALREKQRVKKEGEREGLEESTLQKTALLEKGCGKALEQRSALSLTSPKVCGQSIERFGGSTGVRCTGTSAVNSLLKGSASVVVLENPLGIFQFMLK
jgi:hypothetical protein